MTALAFILNIHSFFLILQAEDSVDDDVLNSFCWMYSSFDMPPTFTFPCARKTYDGTFLYNTYYQWVSIFLAFQAGLFYIPRCLWLIIEGGLMQYIVKGKRCFFIFWAWVQIGHSKRDRAISYKRGRLEHEHFVTYIYLVESRIGGYWILKYWKTPP